jgi:hypothetical protein
VNKTSRPEDGSPHARLKVAALDDVLSRVVRVREALEDGEVGYAVQLAADLEIDLLAAVER